MRQLILLTIIFFISNSLISQTYYSLPDSNAVWSVNLIKYTVQGDTIINGLNYKKYFRQEYDSILTFDKCTYFTAIREELEKIYGIKYFKNTENLLYDYTLKRDDTVWISNFEFGYQDSIKIKVIDVDSVIIDNNYRKRIILGDCNYSSEAEYWVTGIGSLNGLFSQGFGCLGYADYPVPSLLCFQQNDTMKYFNTFYNSCFTYSIGGGIETNKYADCKVLILPNPVINKSILKIDCLNNYVFDLYIYDSFGHLCKI